jgi:hypothetical protein
MSQPSWNECGLLDEVSEIVTGLLFSNITCSPGHCFSPGIHIQPDTTSGTTVLRSMQEVRQKSNIRIHRQSQLGSTVSYSRILCDIVLSNQATQTADCTKAELIPDLCEPKKESVCGSPATWSDDFIQLCFPTMLK